MFFLQNYERKQLSWSAVTRKSVTAIILEQWEQYHRDLSTRTPERVLQDNYFHHLGIKRGRNFRET